MSFIRKERETKRPIVRNCVCAFLVGGIICVIGQAISYFYMYFLTLPSKRQAIRRWRRWSLSMILTGLGVYDRIAQFAGAGSAVPVTGFGNAVISAAIEHRTEGFVLGVGSNMFKLAGSVILFGTFAAFVIALVKTIATQWGIVMLKGHRTWVFANKPAIIATAAVGGPFEANGRLAEDFDLLHEDLWLGEESYEKAHRVLMEEAAFQAMEKAGLEKENVQFLIAGDLINQMTPTSFAARTLGMPYLGVFGACSTSMEGLALSALLPTTAGQIIY
ncbi:stage V sporulation protein AC [Geobacillus zalihae]|uniref:Stage V sporulation protein AC n=1 Tax=Geobacillus zalihae TaxID=213419 RepID=A0A7H1S056_9BACL|nr:stage V sporulation protein AC [Geobacillus zalihae]